jgi:hypothetical protein
MTTRFVCLANSFKEGGRCLAGIELNRNNQPKKVNDNPKWIRPVCKTEHGEVPTHLVSHINILDIVEIDVTDRPEATSYQSENVFFDEGSIKVIGEFHLSKIEQLCDNKNLIFGNRGKAVSSEAIDTLNHSLMLIKTDTFEAIQKKYEEKPDKPQTRLLFTYNGNQYDLPITDPAFINSYQSNSKFLDQESLIYVVLSLGIVWNDWHYKLVAGIII